MLRAAPSCAPRSETPRRGSTAAAGFIRLGALFLHVAGVAPAFTRPSMSEHEIGSLTLVLLLILGLAHLLGWVFSLMRPPRLIGQVLARVVLGPSLLGPLFPGGFAQ